MAGKRAVFLGAMLAFGLLASPAVAAETTVNCAGLQNALNKAANGDRITLDELCKSGFPYKLPGVAFTLAGTPGAGFDGGSTTQLEGSGSAPVIEGLIFENARSTITDTAAGLSLNVAPNGSAVTLAHDTFVNDVASGSESAGVTPRGWRAWGTARDRRFSAANVTRDRGRRGQPFAVSLERAIRRACSYS